MFRVKTKPFYLSTLFLLLSSFNAPAQAQALKNFSAQFEVEALGMTLGLAKHTFSCQSSNCTLTSSAKPSGFAAMLSSDSSTETIKLKQTDGTVQWLSYHKVGLTEKNGKPVTKEVSLKLDNAKNKIFFFKNQRKKREWPAKERVFDSISLGYAMQHAKLNNRQLDDFVLQDSNFQDKLNLQHPEKKTTIKTSFSDRALQASKYSFTSEHVEIELWLLPKYNFFPGKIRIVNQHDKTITLSLAEPPKYYETK